MKGDRLDRASLNKVCGGVFDESSEPGPQILGTEPVSCGRVIDSDPLNERSRVQSIAL